MIENINLLIKFLLSCVLLANVYFFDYDYKVPLTTLILAYILGSIIINPLLKSRFWKFFVYILDLLMLSYFSYATSNFYFSIFYLLLLVPEKNIKDYLFLLFLYLPVAIYNFYQTNFSDFTYLGLILAISLFAIKDILFNKNLEKLMENYVSKTQESFINYLRCKSKSEFYHMFYDISNAINLFKKGKVSPEYFGNFLYENLNADCIIIYDKEFQECYTYGCNKSCQEIKNCEEKIYINETLNNELGYKYIFVKFINNYILVIMYKNYILDEDDIINLLVK